MRRFRQLCAALALACILIVSVSAGDISCGVTGTPPPSPATSLVTEPEETTDGMNGEISDGITEAALTLLQSILSLF